MKTLSGEHINTTATHGEKKLVFTPQHPPTEKMIWLDFGVPCCINLHINKEKQIFLKPLSPYNTSKIFSTNIIDTKTNVLFILLKNNRSYKCEQWFGKRDFLFSLVTLVTVWCQCDKMYKKSLFKVQNYDLIVNLCNKIKKVWFFFKYFIQITVRYRFFFFFHRLEKQAQMLDVTMPTPTVDFFGSNCTLCFYSHCWCQS